MEKTTVAAASLYREAARLMDGPFRSFSGIEAEREADFLLAREVERGERAAVVRWVRGRRGLCREEVEPEALDAADAAVALAVPGCELVLFGGEDAEWRGAYLPREFLCLSRHEPGVVPAEVVVGADGAVLPEGGAPVSVDCLALAASLGVASENIPAFELERALAEGVRARLGERATELALLVWGAQEAAPAWVEVTGELFRGVASVRVAARLYHRMDDFSWWRRVPLVAVALGLEAAPLPFARQPQTGCALKGVRLFRALSAPTAERVAAFLAELAAALERVEENGRR